MNRALWFMAVQLAMAIAVHAQPSTTICSTVRAVLPARIHSWDDIPMQSEMRFELRECDSGAIQVLAFERGQSRPAMFVDINSSWPRQLTHVFNILVLQNIGGSSSTVYVIHFRRGKVQPLTAVSTRGNAKIMVGDDRYVSVEVPPDDRITVRGTTKRFKFPIEVSPNDPDVR